MTAEYGPRCAKSEIRIATACQVERLTNFADVLLSDE